MFFKKCWKELEISIRPLEFSTIANLIWMFFCLSKISSSAKSSHFLFNFLLMLFKVVSHLKMLLKPPLVFIYSPKAPLLASTSQDLD
jgi:hypothetical protein